MSTDNNQDVIDSRDIIERIEELESEQTTLVKELNEGSLTEAQMQAFDKDEGEELDTLRSLAEEASYYVAGWESGETLIRETYFTEYCKEMLIDFGLIPVDIPDYIKINWDQTAENLRVDYTEVDYAGVTYYIR